MSELKQINNGRQQSSYKEFTYTLQPGEVRVLNNPFNYFACLRATADFNIAWSANQMDTNFRQGRKAKFDDVLPYVVFENPQATAIVITVGLGIGDFDDNEFSVFGNIQTVPGTFDAFSATTVAISSGFADIPAATKVIIQNNGGNVMYIGGTGTDGLQLMPGGTFEYNLATPLKVYGTNGDAIAIGSFN